MSQCAPSTPAGTRLHTSAAYQVEPGLVVQLVQHTNGRPRIEVMQWLSPGPDEIEEQLWWGKPANASDPGDPDTILILSLQSSERLARLLGALVTVATGGRR